MAAIPALTIAVTVRYFAAARAAAGVAEEELAVPATELAVPAAELAVAAAEPAARPSTEAVATSGAAPTCEVATVLAVASERHGPELGRVLLRCSFLLDEIAVHGTATTVRHGQVLDVLPPFAGG